MIHNFATDGYCIIIWRAGHLIASDIANALHVRLVAPIHWRGESISARRNLSKAGAFKYVNAKEKEKIAFRDHFKKNKQEPDHFDITIDVSRFETSKLIQVILTAFEMRGFVDCMKKSVTYFG